MIEDISQLCQDAASLLRSLPTSSRIRVVSHYDADGIAAAGVLCTALGMEHRIISIEPMLAGFRTMPGFTHSPQLLGNLMEVRARGASVIAVAEVDAGELAQVAELILPVPPVHPLLQPVVAVVPLQLLAYRVAVELGLDVDQPRNLAKSVTVE